MIRYVLDTDHVTLLKYENPLVINRFNQVSLDELAVTVITVEEQIQGWFNAVRQASKLGQKNRLPWAYLGLREAVQFLNGFQILDFDEAVCDRYLELCHQRIRVGTQDLRIAAIALVNAATLVTRNQQDFAQVPELSLEDWTQ